jgi:hypothetical protein
MPGRITAEYTIRAFWKEAPQVDAVILVRAAMWATAFDLIILI